MHLSSRNKQSIADAYMSVPAAYMRVPTQVSHISVPAAENAAAESGATLSSGRKYIRFLGKKLVSSERYPEQLRCMISLKSKT